MIDIIFAIYLALGIIPALSLFYKFMSKEPISNKLKIIGVIFFVDCLVAFIWYFIFSLVFSLIDRIER